MSTLLTTILPVLACEYGLTPGYWKNYPKHAWPAGYNPDDLFSKYFVDSFSGVTLREALRFHGGPGLDGAKRILARAAVACLLSQAMFDPSEVNWVIDNTNSWLQHDDRAEILKFASLLDKFNNLGPP